MQTIINELEYSNYSHNRGVYNMSHDNIIEILGVKPVEADKFKARYEADQVRMRLSADYQRYYMMRVDGKTHEQAVKQLKLQEWLPERFLNMYKAK